MTFFKMLSSNVAAFEDNKDDKFISNKVLVNVASNALLGVIILYRKYCTHLASLLDSRWLCRHRSHVLT